ncbi:hypothetical protein SESBI_20958 [Sesbania bispinosa]|nr:hypothetical protein SESBI_20958 [Sesbania bispinosa]
MSSNNNMKEVDGSTSNASGFTRNIKITALINNFKRVKAICEEVPQRVCSDFERRCFELPELDLVPTIEEYAVMLGIPVKRDANIYSYKGSHVSMKKVADLIGLPSSQTKFETRGSVQGWKQTFLEDHLKTLAGQEEWDFFKRNLALLMYGLVLFPFTLGVVDQAAMDVFFFYQTQGTNPIMAILADTLMSFGSSHPFRDFSRIEIPEKTAQQWKNDFARYQGQHFPWVCPWYNNRDTIFSCGDFPNVPLMGSRGCIAYTPVIALRQLKWTQFVPDKELLGGICFQYGTNNEQHEQVRRAWEHIHKKGERELGRARAYSSEEYLEWRNERRGDAIPVPMEVQHEDPSRALTNMVAQMEIMRAQMRLIEEREDRAMTEIESLQKQCKKKDELIERQRNECADANTRLAKRPRNGKEVENLSAEVKKLQDKVKTLEEETTKVRTEKEDLEAQMIEQLQEDLQQAQAEAQMIEQLQEDLWQEQAEAESHKNLAGDYSIELMKTKKNERLLEVQVKELKIERNYLQREIEKMEPLELQKDIWKVRAEHEQEQKRKLMQTCERMAEVTQDHVATLTARVHEANEEIDSNPGMKLPWKIYKLVKFCQDVRMMEDLTELTLENEELKKEIKQMRAEMDRMSESMRITEKQNAEGTSTVRQMTQMFEAMQRSAEKRSMMDTTETVATPDYPPGFTQGMMPVTVHLNKPVQQVDPPEVQWPLYGLPPNYTPPIANNASNQTAKPQGSNAKVEDSQLPPQQGSTTNVVRVTPTPSAQQVLNSATPSSQEKGSTTAVLGVTPACNVQWLPGQQATNFGMPNQSVNLVLLRVKAKV